jgi:Fur family ferric uptake transcriptional regulator
MTKARLAALDVLKAAHEPLSVADIAKILCETCDQATVYRSLHFFETKGLVESFVLNCHEHGTERYYVYAEKGHHHWFHCENCHGFLDLGPCQLHELEKIIEKERNIAIKQHILYFIGLCSDCGN